VHRLGSAKVSHEGYGGQQVLAIVGKWWQGGERLIGSGGGAVTNV
jgi:hypothetical protein